MQPLKPRSQLSGYSLRIAKSLGARIVGQEKAIDTIVPAIQLFEAGFAPSGRPVGVFLLLGPTGTGKTKTVEALAAELHGSEKNLLKIDCGEFQMDHEVAKLIGAPPGYLGHRETRPMISQQKLVATASDDCQLSIVLFDEIEKAAPSLSRLLLGVLDRATLHLGDNTIVNFENSLIFLTSNLGASDFQEQIRPDFGLGSVVSARGKKLKTRFEKIGRNAVKRFFSPEFVNRIDEIITYQPLGAGSLSRILDQQLEELRDHIKDRLGEDAFVVEVSRDSREFLLKEGTSPEYGARELKRTIHRHLTCPLAAKVASGEVPAGAVVQVNRGCDAESLHLEARSPKKLTLRCRAAQPAA